jgi:hypothetical protein
MPETQIVYAVKQIQLVIPIREFGLVWSTSSGPLRPPLTSDRREEDSDTGAPDATVPRIFSRSFEGRI